MRIAYTDYRAQNFPMGCRIARPVKGRQVVLSFAPDARGVGLSQDVAAMLRAAPELAGIEEADVVASFRAVQYAGRGRLVTPFIPEAEMNSRGGEARADQRYPGAAPERPKVELAPPPAESSPPPAAPDRAAMLRAALVSIKARLESATDAERDALVVKPGSRRSGRPKTGMVAEVIAGMPGTDAFGEAALSDEIDAAWDEMG